ADGVAERIGIIGRRLVGGEHGADSNRTQAIGRKADPRIAAGPAAGPFIGIDRAFQLENRLQAVAQVFRAAETDTGRVGRHAGAGFVTVVDTVNGQLHQTVDLHVLRLDGQRRGQRTGDRQSKQFLLHSYFSSEFFV